MSPDHDREYVGRGGLKLAHALRGFGIDPTGRVAADLGCHVGGFTDCLLRHGAARVHAVDTAYGTLAWSLRTDSRVVVHERTNALHARPPAGAGIDLVVLDVGWTPQHLAVPAALRWLDSAAPDQADIVSLVKPQYEPVAGEIIRSGDDAAGPDRRSHGRRRGTSRTTGVLDPEAAELVARQVVETLPDLGVEVLGLTRSPIAGGGSRRRRPGNVEYLVHLRPGGRSGPGE